MLGISYISLSTIMLFIIIFGFYRALKSKEIPNDRRNRGTILLALILAGWILYLTLIDYTQVLQNFSLPPRFPLFIFIPFLLITFAFIIRFENHSILKAFPLRWPIYYQTFRIFVELLLLYTFRAEIIPMQATFEGLNYDILMGISAPLVAIFIYQKSGVKKRLATVWNVLGIAMILFVAFIIMTSIYVPGVWGSDVPLVSGKFASMPYLLLPAFLAPSGIFMHVVALMQLRGKQSN